MMELTEEQELYSIQAILCLAGGNFPALVTRLEPHLYTTQGRKDLEMFLQLLILAALFQTKKNMVCSVYCSGEEELVLTSNTGFTESQMAETGELFTLLRSGVRADQESAQAMLELRARNRRKRKIAKYEGILRSSESEPGAKRNAVEKLGELPDLSQENIIQQSAKVENALLQFPFVSKIDLSDMKGWLLSLACVRLLHGIRKKTLRIVSDPTAAKFEFTSEMLDAVLDKENLTVDCFDEEMQRSIRAYFSCGTRRRIVNHSEQQALCPSNSARVVVFPRCRRGRGEVLAGSGSQRQHPPSSRGSSQAEQEQLSSSRAGSLQAEQEQPSSSRPGSSQAEHRQPSSSSQAEPHIAKQLACTMLCCISCFMVVSKLGCFTAGTHGQIYPPVPVQQPGVLPVFRGALRERLTGKKRQRSSDELPATESHNAMYQFIRGLPPCPDGGSSAGASSSGSRRAPRPRRGSARKN